MDKDDSCLLQRFDGRSAAKIVSFVTLVISVAADSANPVFPDRLEEMAPQIQVFVWYLVMVLVPLKSFK